MIIKSYMRLRFWIKFGTKEYSVVCFSMFFLSIAIGPSWILNDFFRALDSFWNLFNVCRGIDLFWKLFHFRVDIDLFWISLKNAEWAPVLLRLLANFKHFSFKTKNCRQEKDTKNMFQCSRYLNLTLWSLSGLYWDA